MSSILDPANPAASPLTQAVATEIAWSTVFLLLAALSSHVKTALLVYSPAKLVNRVQEKDQARLEQRLRRTSDFVTLTSVIKVVGLLLATIWLLAALPSDGWGRIVTVAGFALLAVLLLEVLPTAVGTRHAEATVMGFLPALEIVERILHYPLVRPLGSLREVFTGRHAMQEQAPADREELAVEIRAAVEDSDPGDTLAEEEKEWIENIVELREIDVAQAMTPRTDMVAVEADAPLAEALKSLTRSGHSRFPVFEGRLDSVVGILHLKDAVARLLEPDASPDPPTVRTVMRPPYFVPESKHIADLLRELRARRIQVAVVLDEYGGTAGLITVEDIVEEIVGNIDSEHDRAGEGAVRVGEDGSVDVDARTRVAELNERLELTIPEAEEYDTIGGFVLSHLGRVPRPGDRFTTNNVEFSVLKADARRIGRLRLRVTRPALGQRT